MVKRKKKLEKTPSKFNGTSISQAMADSKFIKEYNTWKSNCLKVSNAQLKVKEGTLWDMLRNHLTSETVRMESKNKEAGNVGRGVSKILDELDEILARDKKNFTIGDIEDIEELSERIEDMEGGLLDPANIVFTEQRYTKSGKKKGKPVPVIGHYRTKTYVDRRKKAGKDDGLGYADKTWFEGNNPPHQALYSPTKTEFADPRGLMYILADAEKNLGNLEINDIVIPPEQADTNLSSLNQISLIRQFFDNVIKTQGFWRKGQGKLMPSNVQREISAIDFTGLNARDKDLVREVANLGSRTERASLAGTVEDFRLKLSTAAVVKLVDAALKRAGKKDGYYRAPDGFIAWQSATSSGFDYRKTRKEVNPEKFEGKNTRQANSKMVSKSWKEMIKHG